MGTVGIHPRGGIALEEVITEIRTSPDARKAGALVTFVGIVREDPVARSGGKVRYLEYEAFKEAAVQKLQELQADLAEREGIVDVSIHHIVDRLHVGEDSLIVAILGTHRKFVFPILEEAVERVKQDVPIWKKEFTYDEAYWVSNASPHGSGEDAGKQRA